MRLPFLLALLALVLLPACGGDDDPPPDPAAPGVPATVEETVPEGVTLIAELSGEAEVPEAGPIAGGGTATVTIAGEELCYELHVEAVEEPEAAHIHEGAAGVAGDVVVPLEAPTDGSARGCTEVEQAVAEAILAEPSNYYVNVHNAEFPAGAVRGQLRR